MLSLLARHWKIAAVVLALLLILGVRALLAPPAISLTAENLHGAWFDGDIAWLTFFPPNRYQSHLRFYSDSYRCGFFAIVDGNKLRLTPDARPENAAGLTFTVTLNAEELLLTRRIEELPMTRLVMERYKRSDQPPAVRCQFKPFTEPIVPPRALWPTPTPWPTSTPRPYPIPTPTPYPTATLPSYLLPATPTPR